jgi:hypothetical protein
MKYKIRYKQHAPKGIMKELEEEVWQAAAKGVIDHYSTKVPELLTEQYMVTFVLEGDKLTIDPDTMTQSLQEKINEAYGETE